MRKMLLSLGLVLLLVAVSAAQIVPKGNIFIGYSYMHQGMNAVGPTNMNGWNGSLEGKVLPFVGLVVDFSGHYGSLPPLPCPGGGPCLRSDFKLYNVLLGPRVSVSIHGVRPFAHALFGVAHETQSGGGSVSDNSFSTAVGGGVDFKLAPIIGWRVQADALRTSLFASSNVNLRASTGLVLRF